ncbi:MAG: hypothetical protein WA947_02835 [Phormidesmis sp.]
MSENVSQVSQWLAEIQSLQQQIAELKKERSQAYSSVDNWRNAYDAEAQQRRRDTEMYQTKVSQLEQSLIDVQEASQASGGVSAAELAKIQSSQSVDQLQGELIAAKRMCDRLKNELQAEQAEHLNTRESLTAALGDAVDLLSKERTER